MVEANLGNVYLWVVGHHALVHAVEGKFFAVRAPEGSLRDAELIAVYALTVNNLSATVLANLCVCAVGGAHIEVAALQEGEGTLLCVGFQKVLAVLKLHGTDELALLPVHGVGLAAIAHHHDALARKGELGVVEGMYLDVLGVADGLVDVVDAEELGLLAVLLVHEVAGIGVLAHELIAPPGTPAVLRHHVAVVVATEVEVFQGESLLALLGWHDPLCLYVSSADSHHSSQ